VHLFITDTGHFYKRNVGSSVTSEVTLPTGTVQVLPAVRPDWCLIPGVDRLPIVGTYAQNLCWFPTSGKLQIMGISAPETAPTLAAGGGVGITGNAIGKYTFAEISGDGTVVWESDGSPSTGIVVLANQDRAWSDLATTHPNPRVNYKRLYVSMDGSDFMFVDNVALADATKTENVATDALGAILETTHGVPPYATFVTYYHGRAWFAKIGSDKIYFSELFLPEGVAATNFVRTQDGRNVTTLRGLTDQLIVATRKSVQDVQGFGLADFNMRMISQDIGGISHHASIVINDKLYLLSQDGYYRVGGGFQYIMPQLRSYFRDAYLADPAAYEDSVAQIDRYTHVLKLLIPGEHSFYYVGHYLPTEIEFGGAGGLPYWTFDKRDRQDHTVGLLTSDDLRDEFYTGSCDGFVRKENVDTDPDDDGDTYKKRITIASKHYYMGDQSGNDSHAHTFTDLTMFVKSEQTDWTVGVYVGDDGAYAAAAPRWSLPVPKSGLTKVGKTAVARTSHAFKVQNGGGKGATVFMTAPSPLSVEYRGHALEFLVIGENGRAAT
jgi:hypothetical protein